MLKNILFNATLICWSLFVEAQDSTFYLKNNKVSTLDSADQYSVGQIEKETLIYFWGKKLNLGPRQTDSSKLRLR